MDALDGLGLVRALTALLAATVLVLGLRAYRVTRRRSMLLLALGMGTASLGYLLQGVLVEMLAWNLAASSVLESGFSLLAFLLIALAAVTRERVAG